MKKILFVILSLGLCFQANAKSTKDLDRKLLKVVEKSFGKTVVVDEMGRLQGENFNFDALKEKKTPKNIQKYISLYFKLHDLNILETDENILVTKSRDAIKMSIPVYHQKVPVQSREQMITLVKDIPKPLRGKSIEKVLRSQYSKDGDIKTSKDKKKIIISDWSSNVSKIVKIIDGL